MTLLRLSSSSFCRVEASQLSHHSECFSVLILVSSKEKLPWVRGLELHLSVDISIHDENTVIDIAYLVNWWLQIYSKPHDFTSSG